MALIVEDGTAKTDSESYISVADADTFHSNRGNADWAALTTTEKEQALRNATDYMVEVYRLQWDGVRVSATQALDWPRNFVKRKDFEYAGLNGYTVIGGDYYYPSDTVPEEVRRACAELALKSLSGELAPDIDRVTQREKLGPLEVEYQDYTKPYKVYRSIDGLLSVFMKGSLSGAFRTLERV